MVFFASRHRIKRLSFLSKLWMTPTAYLLKITAILINRVVDKFDDKVALAILDKATYHSTLK